MKFLPKLIKPAISLGKSILAPLELSAAMSATDAEIQKKKYGSGTTAIIFSNEDLNDMTKIVKALEDSDVLMKGITKTLKNDVKKGGFLSMLPMLETLASLLLTSGKGMYRAGQGIKKNH